MPNTPRTSALCSSWISNLTSSMLLPLTRHSRRSRSTQVMTFRTRLAREGGSQPSGRRQ
jgi:hypothetical protein